MSMRSPKSGFTLLELLAVITILCILIGLLLPHLVADRGASFRNQCQAKIKQLGFALLNHESAYRRFPLIFNAPAGTRPNSDTPQALLAKPAGKGTTASPGNMTGWSWIVRILPYIEEGNLYKAIDLNSCQFGSGKCLTTLRGPFDPAIVNGSAGYQHCSAAYLSAVICPNWAGNANTNGTTSVDNTARSGAGAPEYAAIPQQSQLSMPPGFVNVACPTNYKAIVGTHLQTTGDYPKTPVENGAMLLTASQGATISSISDGMSNTLLLCETKECGYCSWYDGTLNWVVTNNPNAPPPGTNDLPPWTGASTAINAGFDPALANAVIANTPMAGHNVPYLLSTNMYTPTQANEDWGPSSDHPNGAVMHVYADCHVDAITDRVDPATYLNLTTRAGAESINRSLIR
ncbi:MAG TPA: DUF1559 domain-containing protein [Pirellulales bacterium]|jgi:prepilin-type N-terminal cleavage/methylation domain-containing protein|nr:DUF1559 domain-containing protein [Pirellulales bacterium]